MNLKTTEMMPLVWVMVIMLVFYAALLIDWLRICNKTQAYLRYGVWVATVIIGLELLFASVNPALQTPIFFISLEGDVIQYVGLTILGMHYCACLGYPSLPLLQRKLAKPALLDTNSLPIDWKKYLVHVCTVVVLGILYSVGLFLWSKPQLSGMAQRLLGSSMKVTPQATFIALMFAVDEELTFRLVMQNFLANYTRFRDEQYWLAIVITSLLWTLGHAGMLNPDWVKLVQVFPVGLLLGWLSKHHGVESSILAHGLFNLSLLFLAPYLIATS
jgi:membrane protease YdiL (CAAX protease family)